MNNEKGAIFQLMPMKKDDDDGYDILNEIPKYITLNQVNVKIAGGTDKLLVIRDVTSIVMNEQIMETKKEMAKMTDYLMKAIDDHTKQTKSKLESLDLYVNDQGKAIIEDSFNEIQKMRFKIMDFRQIYDISENKFSPKITKVNIRHCMDEFVEICNQDVKNKQLDVSL